MLVLLYVGLWAVYTATAMAATCRDRFLEPFSSDSIWNTAIGSNAHFVPANLFPDLQHNPPTSFHNDQAGG